MEKRKEIRPILVGIWQGKVQKNKAILQLQEIEGVHPDEVIKIVEEVENHEVTVTDAEERLLPSGAC